MNNPTMKIPKALVAAIREIAGEMALFQVQKASVAQESSIKVIDGSDNGSDDSGNNQETGNENSSSQSDESIVTTEAQPQKAQPQKIASKPGKKYLKNHRLSSA